MSDQNKETWEIVGFIDPVLGDAVVVREVLRSTERPEIYFFADTPEVDVREKMEAMPVKDENGLPILGAPGFRRLDTPVPYEEKYLCIRVRSGELLFARRLKD